MTSSLPAQSAMNHRVNGVINTPQHIVQQQHQQQQPQQQLVVQAQGQVVANTAPSILAETTSATWLAIGLLAELLGDMEKALAAYDAVLRHSPNNPETLIKLANVYRSKDVFFKAAELYEQALNFNPENGETWGLLGHCYLMLDDLQRAYQAYQRALYYLGNPNVPKLWHGIGILYDRYGLLKYAEEAFVRVLELDPHFDKSNEIYFRLGIIYKHQGKLQNALDCFQYILGNPPHPLTQPDVWFQIGLVLEQQKDWLGAKEAYEKVLQVNPQHAKVLQQLGCLYSQAEPAPDAASASNGNGATAATPAPFQQDLNVALKYLTQSLEIDQSDAHSWYYLGRVHMIRGDFNAAYEAFQQAVNRDSRNPTFWCSIGVLYYQISQYRDALDAYTRAIRLNPYISEVWYDLGTLYETCNNQISDALDAYRQAERLDPGNLHIKARLDQLIKYQQEGNTHPPQPPPVSQQPRLPQGMVLESNQQPQSGAPQQPQLLAPQEQSSQQPPPPQQPPQQPHVVSQSAQPIQHPPQHQSATVGQVGAPSLPQPSHQHMMHQMQPVAQMQASAPQPVVAHHQPVPIHQSALGKQGQPPMHHQLQPPITTSNGKHALEDKKDHKLVKKASTSKRTPKAVEQDRSINSLVSAATSNTHNGAPPAGLHSSVAPPAHLVSAPITVPVPAPDVVTASPPIKVAEPTTGAVVESVVRSTSSEVAAPSVTANATGVAVTPVESASALTAVPATNNSATNQTDPVPQFSSNVNGNLEDPVELAVTEEPKAAPEVVEPPLRKVDEDENYDDE